MKHLKTYKLFESAEQPPRFVYHYTTVRSLSKIFEAGQLEPMKGDYESAISTTEDLSIEMKMILVQANAVSKPEVCIEIDTDRVQEIPKSFRFHEDGREKEWRFKDPISTDAIVAVYYNSLGFEWGDQFRGRSEEYKKETIQGIVGDIPVKRGFNK